MAEFFLNLSYICNERCVFCAAGLADGPRLHPERPRGLTLEDVQEWISERRPCRGDSVGVAGGEPTLHRDLLPIVRLLADGSPEIMLFTNGLKLADRRFAQAVLDAGVTRIAIGLFGATPATHDAVTRRPGSLERTLRALEVLGGLREERRFTLEIRLLVAEQTFDENPAIVRAVHDRVPQVDLFSLNRLILSSDAASAGSTVSWGRAADAINQTASLITELGHELTFAPVPLCVYRGENAALVRRWAAIELRRPHERPPLRYLDPLTDSRAVTRSEQEPLASPAPCHSCDYRKICGGVEEWYAQRFGAEGLRAQRLTRIRPRAGAPA